ncbi:hypothetical protein HUF18_18705 [Thalassolituus sp. ST750PaO-4]|uniref:hypothetical protein n=1 Tax=Thalassolituus sp. ST750PaO-4 TaxID=2742965 RepID=UPI001CE358C3|nr:hypothetical protein [Thalassolituus sp. ST750PaO-4]MCA6061818.1 hypothetical protein [Thalassolituus sp. ST750PaO-4]
MCEGDDEFFSDSVTTDSMVEDAKNLIALGLDEVYWVECGVYYEVSQWKSLGENVRLVLKKECLERLSVNLYSSWSEFISYKPNLNRIPDNFYVLEDDSFYPSSPLSKKVDNYIKMVSFISLLVSSSDYSEYVGVGVIGKVVFLNRYKLELPVVVGGSDIEFGLDGVSIIDSMLSDGSHKEQKESILKEALCGLLINVTPDERFSYLMKNFGEFSKRFNENYQLFVSEFSFDKVRVEYEESKREYFTKLNEVFSNIQMKMLGVPVALAVSGVNISKIVDGATFWANTFLLISVVVYGVMMVYLLESQKHTLDSIKSEYDSQMFRMKNQYFDQYESISSLYRDLDERYGYQKKCIVGFYVILSVLFIVVSLFFIWSLPWKFMLLGY